MKNSDNHHNLKSIGFNGMHKCRPMHKIELTAIVTVALPAEVEIEGLRFQKKN